MRGRQLECEDRKKSKGARVGVLLCVSTLNTAQSEGSSTHPPTCDRKDPLAVSLLGAVKYFLSFSFPFLCVSRCARPS